MHSCLLYILFFSIVQCLSDKPWSFSQPITYMYDLYYVLLCINYIWNKWTVFQIVALELTILFLLNSISKYFISIKIIQTQNQLQQEWMTISSSYIKAVYIFETQDGPDQWWTTKWHPRMSAHLWISYILHV